MDPRSTGVPAADPAADAAFRADPAALERMIAAILAADGCSGDEAGAVAGHLVEASLKGHDSHGVIRAPRYHLWLKDGTIHGRTPFEVRADTGTLLQLDGHSGMGQWLAREATEAGIERARRHGLCLVALGRAGHIGRLGAYAEQACRAGLVSVQFCNVAGSRLVAPFGGAERRISTAPVAVGVPGAAGGAGEGNFVLDFATSLVAEGKALVAGQGGKALPDDALIGPEGVATGDPRVLYGASLETANPDPDAGAGALRTMGGHKGSGLALACELLAGALTGNGANRPGEQAFGNGWLALFVDPARLGDPGGFAREVGDYLDWVRTTRPARGVAQVMAPGDPERATAAERRAHGLPLPGPVLEALLAVAAELALPFDRDALRMPGDGAP